MTFSRVLIQFVLFAFVLSLSAPLGLAELTQSQKKIIEVYRDLFFSEEPKYSGMEEALWAIQSASTSSSPEDKMFIEAIYGMFDSLPSDDIEKLKQGSKFLAHYTSKNSFQSRSDEYFKKYSIEKEPGAEVVESFERFVKEPNNMRESNLSEIEAERLARSDIQSRFHGALDLEADPVLKQEYLRSLQKYRLQTKPLGTNSISEAQFNAWKKITIEKLEQQIQENQKKLILFFMQELGVVFHVADETFFADDFMGKVIRVTPQNISQVMVQLKTDPASHLFMSTGSNPKNATKISELESLFWRKYIVPRTTKDLLGNLDRYVFLNTFDQIQFSVSFLLNEIRNALRYSPDRKQFRSQNLNILRGIDYGLEVRVSDAYEYINKTAVSGRSRVIVENLYFWGLSKDPHYWDKREEIAKAKNLPSVLQTLREVELPHEKPSLFQRLREAYNSKNKKTSTPRGMLISKTEPTNRFKTNLEMKGPLFSVSQLGLDGEKPDFFQLLDPTLSSERFRVTLGSDLKIKPSVQLKTVEAVSDSFGKIILPTPSQHFLGDLKVIDSKKVTLVAGKDYQVFTAQDGGYFIELRDPKRGPYHFEAKFGRSPHLPRFDEKFKSLDISKIESLSEELRSAGMNALSEGLDLETKIRREKKLPFSVEDLVKVFEKTARYSRVEESSLAKNSQKKSRFSKYSKFLDEKGQLCVQCDGASGIFSEFLSGLFEDDPSMKIRVQVGFSSNDGLLRLSDLHAKTEANVNGYEARVFDPTPRTKDSRTSRVAQVALQTEEISRSDATKVKEYLSELRTRRQKMLSSAKNLKVSLHDSSLPLVVANKMGSQLEDFLAGNTTFEELRANLKLQIPGVSHDYQNIEELFQFYDEQANRLKSRIDGYFLNLSPKKMGIRKEFTDAEALDAIEQLLAKFKRGSQSFDSGDLTEFWKLKTPNLNDLNPCDRFSESLSKILSRP